MKKIIVVALCCLMAASLMACTGRGLRNRIKTAINGSYTSSLTSSDSTSRSASQQKDLRQISNTLGELGSTLSGMDDASDQDLTIPTP